MAKKDPAFLFYPKDWIQGTAKLMPNEKGVYIDFLAHQHQDGDLPNDTMRLARIAGISESDFLPIWEQLKGHFVLNENNRLINRKLTELITERSKKGIQNTIIGTMASVFKKNNQPYELKVKAKQGFDFNEFLDVNTTELTEKVTEWFELRLKVIGNGNENNINNKELLNISKEEEEIKKEEDKVIITLEERKIAFGESLKEFKDKYPREMIADFYNYWREPNKSQTKMKFEMEKTWLLNLRLQRWFKNNQRNKPNNEGLKIDWDLEKKNFLNDTVWQMKISQEKNIKKEVLDGFIKTFIADIEVKDDYKNVAGLKKHFVNSLPKFQSKVELSVASVSNRGNNSHIPTYEGDNLKKLLEKYS